MYKDSSYKPPLMNAILCSHQKVMHKEFAYKP